MVHPRCVQEPDHLPCKIPYKTSSSTKTYFPAARVTLQIEGKVTELAVGVSPHISVDMLLGRDVPHFRKLLKEALEEESSVKPETNSPPEETKEETRIQTSLVPTRVQLDRQHLQDLQEQKEQEEDEPVINSVDSDSPDGEGEEENTLNQLDEVDPSWEAEPEPVEVAVFDSITPDHLKELQKDDLSLQKIREKTKTQGAPYFWKDDILMRQPYHTNGKKLIIIPKAARMKVLQLLTTLHWRVTLEERERWRRSEPGWTGQESPQP